MKKETVFWWVVGFIVYSIVSLFLVGFMVVFISACANKWPTWEMFSKIPLILWIFASQIVLLSLILTAAVRKAEQFLLKKSRFYRWIYYS